MDLKAIFIHINIRQLQKWEHKLERWENNAGEVELRADLSDLPKGYVREFVSDFNITPDIKKTYDYVILWR